MEPRREACALPRRARQHALPAFGAEGRHLVPTGAGPHPAKRKARARSA